jgi:RNA polymerase sigma factor (sigma-70 family)
VNCKDPDSTGEAGRRTGCRSSKSVLFEIFITERDRLKRIVAGMGLSTQDAEDALQDVSVKVLRQRRKWESRENTVRWLTKVTVNRCLMHHRHRKRFSRSAAEIIKRRTENAVEAARTDAKAIAAEEVEIVRQTLSELDESLLTTMVLRYFGGLNSTEIGQILGLSASAVRSRLREARMILAGKLMERGVEP